jgi:hypothetical protein
MKVPSSGVARRMIQELSVTTGEGTSPILAAAVLPAPRCAPGGGDGQDLNGLLPLAAAVTSTTAGGLA